MPITDYAQRILELAETVYRWLGQMSDLQGAKREKVALYAEEIAATLARATLAFAALEQQPTDKQQILAAARELGRIAGYVDTIVAALAHHLDGRKLAGVKRRLEHLQPFDPDTLIAERGAFAIANRLTSAEGFFRALADALRT
jgi:anti-sigma-K factor RskA